MKLSTTVEQACCIIAMLAHPAMRDKATNDQLAQRMAVSPTYLRKVTRKLVVRQLVRATHGAGGGLELARPMDRITLYDVVAAVEGEQPFFQSRGVVERVFAARQRQAKIGLSIIEQKFHQAEQQWRATLEQISLADVVAEIQR